MFPYLKWHIRYYQIIGIVFLNHILIWYSITFIQMTDFIEKPENRLIYLRRHILNSYLGESLLNIKIHLCFYNFIKKLQKTIIFRF